MRGTKDCWNIICACWTREPETSNCMAEDLEPQDCKLADIDLRIALTISNTSSTIIAIKSICESIDPHELDIDTLRKAINKIYATLFEHNL